MLSLRRRVFSVIALRLDPEYTLPKHNDSPAPRSRYSSYRTLLRLSCTFLILFGFAHTLSVMYSQEGQPQSTILPVATLNSPTAHQVAFPPPSEPPLAISTDEHYLTYLPHSGFHNQRIALENALTLAYALNRTLVLPPIRLGTPVRYLPSDGLRQLQAQNHKAGLEYCAHDTSSPRSDDCSEQDKWTLLPWNWLIDLDALTTRLHVRVIQRFNMSDIWPTHLEEFSTATNDVWTLNDTSLYQYRIIERLPQTKNERHKFSETKSFANSTLVNLGSLASRTVKHLAFGTLFGSSRLWLMSDRLVRARTTIRTHMVFTNPTLRAAVDGIGTHIRGPYISAHVRIGDGAFLEKADLNAQVILERLLVGLKMNTDNIAELIKYSSDTSEASRAISSVSSTQSSSNSSTCTGLTSSRFPELNIPLYIATDADTSQTNPHPVLQRFTKVFPCIHYLSSFTSFSSPINHAGITTGMATLDNLVSGYNGLALRPFVESFVEAMIVSRAELFVGTEQSTFSQFVSDVLSRVWRGYDIIERG